MLSSSLDTLLKVSKTTSPQKPFAYDCVTLYLYTINFKDWAYFIISLSLQWFKLCAYISNMSTYTTVHGAEFHHPKHRRQKVMF